jgi:hypothetical protein
MLDAADDVEQMGGRIGRADRIVDAHGGTLGVTGECSRPFPLSPAL